MAAADPRIRVTVASGSFRGVLPPFKKIEGRPLDLPPPETAALIAPRALPMREFEGGPEWRGEVAWAFLRRHLSK